MIASLIFIGIVLYFHREKGQILIWYAYLKIRNNKRMNSFKINFIQAWIFKILQSFLTTPILVFGTSKFNGANIMKTIGVERIITFPKMHRTSNFMWKTFTFSIISSNLISHPSMNLIGVRVVGTTWEKYWVSFTVIILDYMGRLLDLK